ncbi:MAG: PspA/IM30 family protein [Armatimonadetes bacterium]|nr:PspA/IM30 family protein [Armatimonadota bacterium]
MKRFFNWVRALFNRAMDNVEQPDMMLDQARRDMQNALVANREKAVQAITQKNRLIMMLDEAKKKSEMLESQATAALKQDKRELALQFMREKASNDSTVATLQSSYEQATQAVEQVKAAIKLQEEEVRKKTAEALAMKAQWQQAQIQNSISKALEGLTFENQYESSFGVAKEKIQNMQSEAAARQELMAGSLQGKVMQLQDSAMDMKAEQDLQMLESKLGMGTSATAPALDAGLDQHIELGGETKTPEGAAGTPPATPEQMAEADRQLDELEKRLKGS